MKQPTHPLSIRIDAKLKEVLERLAKNDGMSLTKYVEMVLKQHVGSLDQGA